MEIKDVLKEIGLNDDETKIYLGLLKTESAVASDLATKTSTNRPLTYQILDQLIFKGFASYFLENNVRHYRAVPPEKLLEIIKEKQEHVKEIIPLLNSIQRVKFQKPIIEIFHGSEGIKTILNDILRQKIRWCAFGSGKSPEVINYYAEHWEKARVKEKIQFRAILDDSESGNKRGHILSKLPLTKIRYMKGNILGPSSTWIYGDRLVIIAWDKENAFAIRTISKDIAKSYQAHFEWLWKLAKK